LAYVSLPEKQDSRCHPPHCGGWQNAGGKTQVAKHGAVNLWLTARGAENRQLRWEHYNKPILCQKWRVNKPQIRGIYKLLKTKNGAF
jgi:hypothetical protein